MAWGFPSRDSPAKTIQKAIVRETSHRLSDAKHLADKVSDRAEHTIANARDSLHTATDSAKTVTVSVWNNITTNTIPFIASFFQKPSFLVLLQCYVISMTIQTVFGFVPHAIMNKVNHSQILAGVNILALVAFSVYNNPKLSFQQLIPTILLCEYALYLCFASLNIRSYHSPKTTVNEPQQRQHQQQQQADHHHDPAGKQKQKQTQNKFMAMFTKNAPQIFTKSLFWARQVAYVFLVCAPVILANSNVISPKTVPVSTWFGSFSLPFFSNVQTTYPYFHIKNLEWTNIAGAVVAMIGLMGMIFADVQNHWATKEQDEVSHLEPVKNRKEFQQQQEQLKSARALKGIISLRFPSFISEFIFLCGLYLSCFNCLTFLQQWFIIPPLLGSLGHAISSILQTKTTKIFKQFKNSDAFRQLRDRTLSLIPYVNA